MSCPNSTRTAFAKTVHSVTHRRTSKHSTSEFNFDAPGLDGTLFVNCSKECKAREGSNRSAELVARKKKSCEPESQKQKRPCHPVWPSDYFSSCYHPSIVLYKKQFIMFHISYFSDKIRQDVSDPELLTYFDKFSKYIEFFIQFFRFFHRYILAKYL